MHLIYVFLSLPCQLSDSGLKNKCMFLKPSSLQLIVFFFILMISLALPVVRVARVKMASVSICPIHVHCQSGLLPESKFIVHQQELCQSSQGANFMFEQKEAQLNLNT